VRVPLGASILVLQDKWAERIFNGEKSLEIRCQPTHKRRTVYVIVSGSYFITGMLTDLWV